MDQAQFDSYLKDRYEDQTQWYDSKSQSAKKVYRILQWSSIVLSALTPILILLQSEYGNLLPVVCAVTVAIITSALKIFRYQELWIDYRTTCETLKKEIYLYQAGVDQYSTADDKESLFVQRVESLISRENTLWLRGQNGENDDNKDTANNG